MYATLEEAYRTPFMEPKRRRAAKLAQELAESGTAGYVNAREEFTGTGPERKKDNYLSTAPKDAYAGRLNDYTFGCKQYGVCPKTLMEGFSSGSGSASAVPPAPRGKQPLTKKITKCAPLSPPNYEYPMSDEDKKQFNQAMQAALQEDYENDPPAQKATRLVDMGKVDGYGDDDLDQYLSIDNMKDQITLSPPPPPAKKGQSATPYDPEYSPFAELLKEAAASRRRENLRSARGERWNMPGDEEVIVGIRPPMWMDLLLFALIGVLVILIMDQLFRLAMISGMQQTLEILRPFLEGKALE